MFVCDTIKLRHKKFIFRGHHKENYKLKSSIQRAFEILGIQKNWRNARENAIIKDFMSQSHSYLNHLPDGNNQYEWLSIMQHSGAPTRLLDWTYSPFIAAFFALERLDDNCVIFQLDRDRLETTNRSKEERIGDTFENILFKNSTNNRLIYSGLQEDFVFLYEPTMRNERLVAQQGIFLIPSTTERSIQEIILEDEEYRECIVRYVFKMGEDEKRDAVRVLRSMNIDNFRLFPGIDGLSRSLYHRLLERST
jgi:hypothetical protein